MALKFNDPEFSILNLIEKSDIPPSSEISGIELRLTDVFIIDNDTHALLNKAKDKAANLYVLIITINDLGDVVQTLNLEGFPKVLDKTSLNINRTIHFWQKTTNTPNPPAQIHTFISIIKSKQNLRDTGQVLANAKNDQEYSALISSIKGIVTNATPVGQVADLVLSLASIVGKLLGNVKDVPLFTWFQSFTNLGGDFDKEGIESVSQKNNFVSVNINRIIRDSGDED
ncbi:hypothetical protein [Emticicia fontis]